MVDTEMEDNTQPKISFLNFFEQFEPTEAYVEKMQSLSNNAVRIRVKIRPPYRETVKKLLTHEYKVLAFELISDYIPPDIENTLRQQLNIPDCNKIASTSSSKVISNKRKIESDNDHKTGVQSVHSNDAYDWSKQVESDNKKQKFSRSQRELSKVDRSGIKSIASYFKKK